MSGLVGYGSSDEEDDVQSERPAKIAKTEPTTAQTSAIDTDETAQYANPPPNPIEPPQSQHHPSTDTPAPGPSIPTPSHQPTTEEATTTTPASTPLSPYSSTRQKIQELTLPTHPNFSIPPSPPPPPPSDPEALANLAATTKKFNHFLSLKAQNVHFNARLQNSSALRNPGVLPKLMEFAGISTEESYASTLEEEEGLGVPGSWREECYVENLVRENERREKKKRGEGREKVEFVSARGSKSDGSSRTATPKGGGGSGNWDGARRTKFDRRK